MAAIAVAAIAGQAVGGTWTRLVRNAPGAVNQLLLLSDGTVMAAAQGSAIGSGWYRLTPDSHGSYINGTWTTLASMQDTRLYYSSAVLRDGRVFVAGGEYGTGFAKSEVYNPLTNSWSAAPISTAQLNPAQQSPAAAEPQGIYDACSELLPNGNVIVTPVAPRTYGGTLIYNPTTNAWSAGPTLFRGGYQAEASWVKLPDNTILTIDPFGVNCERYNPVSNSWINDSNTTNSLYDPVLGEMGPAILLPSGKAFFVGGSGHTAVYTPTGTTAPGSWMAGPDVPGNLAAPDAPGAMLVTGRVLCAVGPKLYLDATNQPVFPTPTSFYEYDPATNAFAVQPAPVGVSDNIPPYATMMLALPDGNVLYSHYGADLYVYQPTGTAQTAGRPVVASLAQNADGTYHLTGTGFNGMSVGAAYGDDAQMNTNYPLVRFSGAGNAVFYARTFNWSSTGVMTGALPVSTEFKLPTVLQTGQFSLAVIANGIASAACVGGGPSVTVNTPSMSVCSGGNVALSVSTTDAGVTFQWRKGLTTLANGGTISGADTATLTITGAGVGDSDPAYRCIVSNACGIAVTTSIPVTISGSLSIGTQPMSQAACFGQSASLSVVADGAATYQWTKGDVDVPGATGATLSIPFARAADAGVYRCVIGSGCGSATSDPATVSVCVADFDCLYGITTNDIFSYLNRWFQIDPRCDINGVDGVTVQDIFDFINAWLAGCS
jgi:hypothetical protein